MVITPQNCSVLRRFEYMLQGYAIGSTGNLYPNCGNSQDLRIALFIEARLVLPFLKMLKAAAPPHVWD
jgi:hypothetical protein